jgi:hypothetical protein
VRGVVRPARSTDRMECQKALRRTDGARQSWDGRSVPPRGGRAHPRGLNPGSHHPKAENKTSVSAAGDFPVQNGKADFTLSATATFQPQCSPPMTVVFTDVTVTDTTNGLTHSFPGTF